MTVSIFTAKPKLPKNPLCDMVIITGSRYLVAGNTLLIRDVSPSDAGAYSCLARHAVTGATRRARPALLAVTGECAPHCEPAPPAPSLTCLCVQRAAPAPRRGCWRRAASSACRPATRCVCLASRLTILHHNTRNFLLLPDIILSRSLKHCYIIPFNLFTLIRMLSLSYTVVYV